MYRVWVDLRQPFGKGYLPKEFAWKFDVIGIPIFNPMPEIISYHEFNTVSDASDFVDVFFNGKMLRGEWVPARGLFRVVEVPEIKV